MERNSVIAPVLEKLMCDKLPRTGKYERLLSEARKIDQDVMRQLGGDEQLLQKYLAAESITNEAQLEYESMCFCEGVRLGFKLCMDIFEI